MILEVSFSLNNHVILWVRMCGFQYKQNNESSYGEKDFWNLHETDFAGKLSSSDVLISKDKEISFGRNKYNLVKKSWFPVIKKYVSTTRYELFLIYIV